MVQVLPGKGNVAPDGTRSVTAEPVLVTLHTEGVRELKLTAKEELLVAVTANGFVS